VLTVLVVDDSAVDRQLAGGVLQKQQGVAVTYAKDGVEALAEIRRSMPDAVVTDLQMPELNGLELVEIVKRDFPRLPVILMTAQGSELVATEALRKGAASYVPKTFLATHLGDTVVRILSAAAADRHHSRLMNSLADCRCRFVIQNDPGLVEPLVGHFTDMLHCLPLGDESERLRVCIAVKHALLNGLYHGNLEIPPDLPDVFSAGVSELVDERCSRSPYAERCLRVEAQISSERAEFRVEHDGPGLVLDDRATAFDEQHSTEHLARGAILMRSIMDEVRIEQDGRRVVLIKHAAAEPDVAIEE